jgi:hypothetical protein
MFDVDGTLLLSDRSLSDYQLLPGAAETLTAPAARRPHYVLGDLREVLAAVRSGT